MGISRIQLKVRKGIVYSASSVYRVYSAYSVYSVLTPHNDEADLSKLPLFSSQHLTGLITFNLHLESGSMWRKN
jgi:hypothetical protein